MAKLNVYLNFAGNTEEAFNFYRSVFGGEFQNLERFKDMPKESGRVAENEKNKILNISLPVDGNTLMASDTLGSRGQRLIQGNNFYISITPESKQEANRIFKALSEDGRIILEISDQPWNAYYGSFVDKFGIRWMVNYPYPKGIAKTRTVKTGVKAKVLAVTAAKKETAKAKPGVKPKIKAKPVKTRKVKNHKKPSVKAAAPVKKKKPLTAAKTKPKTLPAPKRKNKASPARKNKIQATPAVSRRVKNVPAMKHNRSKRELTGAGKGR